MINLIRMDIYRMRKNKAFWICLILAMISAFVQTPFAWLMSWLGSLITEEPFAFENTALLSQIIGKPFPMFNAVLVMLSACSFFYADIANGYIKNIAGQMPKRGYTILSKFYAIIPYNLIFMLAAVICNIAGTMLFQKIAAERIGKLELASVPCQEQLIISGKRRFFPGVQKNGAAAAHFDPLG